MTKKTLSCLIFLITTSSCNTVFAMLPPAAAPAPNALYFVADKSADAAFCLSCIKELARATVGEPAGMALDLIDYSITTSSVISATTNTILAVWDRDPRRALKALINGRIAKAGLQNIANRDNQFNLQEPQNSIRSNVSVSNDVDFQQDQNDVCPAQFPLQQLQNNTCPALDQQNGLEPQNGTVPCLAPMHQNDIQYTDNGALTRLPPTPQNGLPHHQNEIRFGHQINNKRPGGEVPLDVQPLLKRLRGGLSDKFQDWGLFK